MCRLDEFMAGFSEITLRLKEMYQMITLGGDAELELVDSLDPFSEGIVFSVRPPKKSWKNISNLSGGEKVNFQGNFTSLIIFRHFLRLLLCLHCIIISLRHCMLWMRLMLHWTLRMYLL
jgi:hypothetical protein